MSGLYNMVMGRNPALGHLLVMVGIDSDGKFERAGRVRDGWITEDAKTIGIFHRNYGEDGQDANDFAASLPGYRELAYDNFDGTYGWWLFDVPEEHCDLAERLAELTDNTNCMDRYKALIKDLEKGVKNEMTDQAVKAGERIAESLMKSFEDGKSRSVENEDGSVDIRCFGKKDKET